LNVEERFDRAAADRLIVTSVDCPTQTARAKRGLEEYGCKEMRRKEFVVLSQEVDARIRVECVFAPPHHPPDIFCRWRFTMKDSEAAK